MNASKSSSSRRSMNSSHIREPKPQLPAGIPAPSRRRRSKSPPSRKENVWQELPREDKKKKASRVVPTYTEEMLHEQSGEKARAKKAALEELVVKRGRSRSRSRSRERRRSVTRPPVSHVGLLDSAANTAPELQRHGQQQPSPGPSRSSERARLRKELEAVKKQLAVSYKTVAKQSKVIDELRGELAASLKTHKDQDRKISKLKTASKKSEDVIASIEGNLNCQVCLERLMKPYALSPCGHVLCLACLQGWFRAPRPDDMDTDTDPADLLHKIKTCPCCRAKIRTRPIQLFLLKSIASSLPNAPRQSPPLLDHDPWAGIFAPAPDDNDSSDGDEDDDDGDEDDDGGDGWSVDMDEMEYDEVVVHYGTDSEEEPYEGRWVRPVWAPPSVYIDETHYEDASLEDLRMLRRGASLEMIDRFDMRYTHSRGLVATVDSGDRIYLGWNVALDSADVTGDEYVEWLMCDMNERPERWSVAHRAVGWTAWRLVPEAEAEPYDSTDTEAWLESDDVD